MENQKKSNLYLGLKKEEFVQKAVEGLPQPLSYFGEDVRQNKEGCLSQEEIMEKGTKNKYKFE